MTQHNSKADTVRSIVAPLAALALLTTAGCGGDETGSPQRSPTSSVTASSEASSGTESERNGSDTTSSATPRPNTPSHEGGGGSDETDDSGGTGTGNGSAAPSPGGGDGSDTAGKRPEATLADMDPCALLTPAQRDELGLPRATANKEEGKSRSCEFNPPKGSGPSTSALIVIHEDKGLNSFSGMTGEAERTRVAGHDSKIQCEYGNCLIGIAVTENSRVDVQSTVLGDDTATEKLGDRIAKMVTGNLSNS